MKSYNYEIFLFHSRAKLNINKENVIFCPERDVEISPTIKGVKLARKKFYSRKSRRRRVRVVKPGIIKLLETFLFPSTSLNYETYDKT